MGDAKRSPIGSDRIVLDASTEAMAVHWMRRACGDSVCIRDVDAEIGALRISCAAWELR